MPLIALRTVLHYPAANPSIRESRGCLAARGDVRRCRSSMVETSRALAVAGPAGQDAIELIEATMRGIVAEQRLTPGAALAVVANGRLAIDLLTGYADTQRARAPRS